MSEKIKAPLEQPSAHSTARSAIAACLAALSVAGAGCDCGDPSRVIVIHQPDLVFPPAKPEEIMVGDEQKQVCRHMNEAETRWYEEMLRQDHQTPPTPEGK